MHQPCWSHHIVHVGNSMSLAVYTAELVHRAAAKASCQLDAVELGLEALR